MDRDAFWDAIYRCDETAMAACLAAGVADGTDLRAEAQAVLRWLRARGLWMKVGMTLTALARPSIPLDAEARAIGLWALERTVAEAEAGDAESWWNSTSEIYENIPLEGIDDGERRILLQTLTKASDRNEWEHVFRLLRIAHRAGVDVAAVGRRAFARAEDPENQFRSDFGWDYLPDIVAALADTGVLSEAEAAALTHVGPLLRAADRGADFDFAPVVADALAWAERPDPRWAWEHLSRILVPLDDAGPYHFDLGKKAPKVVAALAEAPGALTEAAAAVVRKHARPAD